MALELLNQLMQSLLLLIKELGYFGVFIGMTIESSFFPFPSEIILIPAGALIAQKQMDFFPVFIAGLAGSLLGALINYSLAFFLGRRVLDSLVRKYGKILFLNEEKLDKTDDFFKKHGQITTFTGRLIPGVRQLISIPAGFSKMNLSKFIFFTLIGAGVWTAILIFIGYFFGSNYDAVYKNIALIIILISSILILFYILKKKRHK